MMMVVVMSLLLLLNVTSDPHIHHQTAQMIDFLLEHAPHTPRLFETRVSAWRVTGLSKVLDEYQVSQSVSQSSSQYSRGGGGQW
jgi:hypothetical protein